MMTKNNCGLSLVETAAAMALFGVLAGMWGAVLVHARVAAEEARYLTDALLLAASTLEELRATGAVSEQADHKPFVRRWWRAPVSDQPGLDELIVDVDWSDRHEHCVVLRTLTFPRGSSEK